MISPLQPVLQLSEQTSNISLYIQLCRACRSDNATILKQMGNFDLCHHVSSNAVPTGNHTATRQNLGDPERLMTALQALSHQSECAHAEQGAVQLLGQGAGHDDRQSGAGEASRARCYGKALNLWPTAPGQQGIHPLNQAVGEGAAIIKNSNSGNTHRVLHGDPETIGAAVQGKQQRQRRGVTHNG